MMAALSLSNGQQGPPALGFQFTAEYFARPEDFEPPTEEYCEDDDMKAYLGVAEAGPIPSSAPRDAPPIPPPPTSSYIAAPATLAVVQIPRAVAEAGRELVASAVQDSQPPSRISGGRRSPPVPVAAVPPLSNPAVPIPISKIAPPEPATTGIDVLDERRLALLLEATCHPEAPVARQCFQALDPLGRGRVSVVVWAKGMTQLGVPVDVGNAMEVILQAHPDAAGFVDYNGFLQLLRIPRLQGRLNPGTERPQATPPPPASVTSHPSPPFVALQPSAPQASPSPQPRPVSPPVTALRSIPTSAPPQPPLVMVAQQKPSLIAPDPSQSLPPPLSTEINEAQWKDIPGTGCQFCTVSSWPVGYDFVPGGIQAAVTKLQGTTSKRANWTLHASSSVIVRKSSQAAHHYISCKHCGRELTFSLTLPSTYPGQLFGCDQCSTQQLASAGVWHCDHCHEFDLCLGCLPPPESMLQL
eukprot:GGOE01000774.1.p1 GENE.GGOE01000774.1~~GGOE01000774.1.p1  ORF type:complete len:470 (+),score=86.58 GGOE01000774.1:51-1460(+)